MDDWERFLTVAPWFVKRGQSVAVGETRAWGRGEVAGLARLSELLGRARVTAVEVGGTKYELLGWGTGDARRGWLTEPAHSAWPEGLDPLHVAFAGVCGGVVERFGEPESRWLNHNEVLTAGATRLAVGQVLADYGWIWERAGIGVPIDGEAYYVVGVEANGNLTLAPRAGGRLLLFAPDHSFDDVTPLEGCPPYSLYTFDGVPDLGSWIEDAAESWLRG